LAAFAFPSPRFWDDFLFLGAMPMTGSNHKSTPLQLENASGK